MSDLVPTETTNEAKYPPTPASVLAKIADLPNLPMPKLKALWLSFFPKANANHHRAFLQKRIAHRLQEIEFRKHPEGRNLLERNQRKIDALIEVGKVKRRGSTIALTPGTMLMREYRDVEHQVLVCMDGGFEYRGCRYSSLSKIASEISGCAMSGPVFFGLKPPSSKSEVKTKTKKSKIGAAA